MYSNNIKKRFPQSNETEQSAITKVHNVGAKRATQGITGTNKFKYRVQEGKYNNVLEYGFYLEI